MFFISSCPLGLLHLCDEGYRLSGANKLCCYLSLKARWSHNKEFNILPQHKLTFCATTALDFKPYTEDSVNSTIQLNKHSPLLTHNFSPFCYQETSDRTSVLPVTLQQVLFPPPHSTFMRARNLSRMLTAKTNVSVAKPKKLVRLQRSSTLAFLCLGHRAFSFYSKKSQNVIAVTVRTANPPEGKFYLGLR